jgi:hypothetical protein
MTNAISACKASSISPGCNPGSAPQQRHTPCKGSSQMRPRQLPSNAEVKAAQRSRARGVQSRRGSPRKVPPSQSNAPREGRCCTHGSHRTRSVRLRTALTGRSCRGWPDLAFHARLMELALQAANAHASKGAMHLLPAPDPFTQKARRALCGWC